MALKALMTKRKLDLKTEELRELEAKDENFLAREKELTASIGEAKTAEERETVEAAVNAFDADHGAHEDAKAALRGEISALEAELAELENNDPPAPTVEAAAEHHKKGMTSAMLDTIDIFALPKNRRIFDALPMAQRQQIVAQDDVQKFLTQLRSFKGGQASVSGADLLVPEILLDLIAENRFRYSKLLNRVRRRNLRGKGKQPVAGLIPPAIWVGACKRLNEITLEFNAVTLDDYKNAAVIPVCNTDLEDSDIGLAAFIVEAISQSLGLSDDMAILYGKGAAYNMPLGVVTRLAQTVQPDNYPVDAPDWVDLHTTNIISINGPSLTGAAFWAALRIACGKTFTRYSRGELSWAMNSQTYAELESKAIATTVTGEWVALIGGRLPIVSGDIDVLEFIPDHDIIGGYFDLYLWGQRAGMMIGMDETGYQNRVADQTLFFGKERADGLPVIPGAFVAININNQTPATSILFPTDDANTVTGVLMNTATAAIEGTGTVQLEAIPLPFGVKVAPSDITWASGTSAKATVSSSGLVTGVTAGNSVITATINGKTAQCTVTVT